MEKIFKREDGSRIKLCVRILYGQWTDIDVYIAQPKKKKFIDVHNANDYTYRALNMEERRRSRLECQLQYVTKEEINACIRELVEDVYQKNELK